MNSESGCVDSAEDLCCRSLDLARVFLGIAVLLCEQFLPLQKLSFGGVPINTFVYLFSFFVMLGIPDKDEIFSRVIPWFIPLFIAGISLSWSADIENGLYKYSNLIVSSFVAVVLMIQAAQNRSYEWVLGIWLGVLSVLLCLGLLYKARSGFFDRETLFFLNGPIVFGRFMACAALISLLIIKGIKRWMLFCLFFLAVVWTASKGPLLALIIVTGVYLFKKTSRSILLFLCFSAAFLLYLAWLNLDTLNDIPTISRYVMAVNYILEVNGAEASNYGSIGIRQDIYGQTVELIKHYPWGVGIGGWSSSVPESFGFEYPHNFLLELICECGWVLGLIALVPFIAFLGKWKSPFVLIPLLFFLAQQVSGDLLDARYLLSFSLLSILSQSFSQDLCSK